MNELKLLKPEKRMGGAKLAKRIIKTAGTALDTLEEILTDESVKSGDRLSAVKLAFDLLKMSTSDELLPASGPSKVIIEGIEPPLCE